MRLDRIGVGLLALVASTGFVACGDKSEDFETFVATCGPEQENPPVTSSGSCRAVVLVSTSLDRVDVSVNMSGLENVTQAHIHRGVRGINGGVIFWLWQLNNTTGANYPATPNLIGKSWQIPAVEARDEAFSQRVIDDLRAGNLYVNFHTTRNPGGEIRGQLTRQ